MNPDKERVPPRQATRDNVDVVFDHYEASVRMDHSRETKAKLVMAVGLGVSLVQALLYIGDQIGSVARND